MVGWFSQSSKRVSALGVDEGVLIAQPRAAVVPSARHLVQGAGPLDFGGVSADDEQPGLGV
jgi:hypothetical protein